MGPLGSWSTNTSPLLMGVDAFFDVGRALYLRRKTYNV
jgi:hypothetical protein